MGAGNVNQVIVEMDGGYLFVTTVSEGSALAVMCGPECDIGLIGYEMSMLVARIGQVLTPAMRAELSMRPGP
jgi:predicted regulator of Ras-like GTPase activity (Roadblock/LC7/MglB family)